MAHIISPVSHRLSISRFWDSNWALSSTSLSAAYSYMTTENILFFKYFKRILNTLLLKLFQKGVVFSRFSTVRVFKNLFLIFYVRLLPTAAMYDSLRTILSQFLTFKKYQAPLALKSLGFLKKKPLSKNLQVSELSKKTKHIPPFRNRLEKLPIVYPNFLMLTSKIRSYDPIVDITDLNAHVWNNLSSIAKLKRTNGAESIKYRYFSKALHHRLTLVLLKFVFLSRWLKSIKYLLRSLSQRIAVAPLNVDVLLVAHTLSYLSATFLARYISTRLLQKFPIRRIVGTVLQQMKFAIQKAQLHGFKLICNGRFERRGRASHVWKIGGKVPSSNPTINVDYALMLPVLINSICSVKVWITRNTSYEKFFIL